MNEPFGVWRQAIALLFFFILAAMAYSLILAVPESARLPTAEPQQLPIPDACPNGPSNATITYVPRESAVIGQTLIVSASVSLDDYEGPAAQESGDTRSVDALLSCVIEASLIGTDFTIQPSDWDEQSFLGRPDRHLIWTWTVLPQTAGDDRPLRLALRSRVDQPGFRDPVPLVSDPIVIEVDVDEEPVGVAEAILRWVRDVLGHPFWQAIAGLALFVTIVLAVPPFSRLRIAQKIRRAISELE